MKAESLSKKKMWKHLSERNRRALDLEFAVKLDLAHPPPEKTVSESEKQQIGERRGPRKECGLEDKELQGGGNCQHKECPQVSQEARCPAECSRKGCETGRHQEGRKWVPLPLWRETTFEDGTFLLTRISVSPKVTASVPHMEGHHKRGDRQRLQGPHHGALRVWCPIVACRCSHHCRPSSGIAPSILVSGLLFIESTLQRPSRWPQRIWWVDPALEVALSKYPQLSGQLVPFSVGRNWTL